MSDDKIEKIRWDKNDLGAVKPELLDTFDYEYPGKDIMIKLETNEFGAVCPWSGLPDFGTILIEYIPDKLILELKSLKYYLYTFRSVGVYQEHVINRIFDDVKKKIKPKKIKITLTYNIRGGINTTVIRESK
ncbi:MAG: preQ(1) synthase [Spirochaetes bacterium]|nr:preQ(1) synthase [Spirochaetota bacterium]